MQIYNIEPYYKLVITSDSIKVFSYSKWMKGQELVQKISINGYIRVRILRKYVSLHSLVLHYTSGPRPDGFVINHKDGNKLNNHPDNLEYCTQSANINHAFNLGLRGKGGIRKHKDYSKNWYLQNRERILEKVRKYREENLEEVRLKDRLRYKAKVGPNFYEMKEYKQQERK